MRLKQEAEPFFGEQSDRLLPNRSIGRLPWFAVRGLAFRIGTAALSVTGLTGMNPPEFNPLNLSSKTALAQTAEMDQKQLVSDAVTRWNTVAVKEEALGESFELTGQQLSSGFTDSVGYSVLFQSMLVTLDSDGNPILRNLLTEEEQNGFDTHSVPPFFGDAAPIKGVFTVDPSPKVIEMTAALGRVFGLPDLQITGAARFGAGGYNSYRIGDAAGDKLGLIEYPDDDIRMAQFGNSATQAGIVPESFMLQPGELAQGGGGVQTSPEASVSSESIAVTLKEQYGIDPLIWKDVDKKGNKVTRLFAVVGTPTFPLKAADYSEDVTLNVKPEYIDPNVFPKGTTREAAIKKIMHDEDIPQILVLPGKTTHFSYFSVGSKENSLGRTPYIYPDLVIKPDAYPNAIVWFYEEANTFYTLDPERKEDLSWMFFGLDMAEAMKIFHNPEVTPNTFVYGDETRDLAREILGGKLSLVIKPVTLAKETTPPSA